MEAAKISPSAAKARCSGATLNLKNLTIADGFIQGAGGGISNDGTLSVTNCTFSGNSARALFGGDGGGISSAGTLTVTNCTFSGNSASGAIAGGAGGGISSGGTLTVTNSTFSGNSALMGSGGILNSGTANLKGTILAANVSNCEGSITDQGYNISDDTSCGFSATGSANNGDGVDPKLSAAGLANNGGPTLTIALQSDSPAIDVIPVADCTDQASPPKRIATDQRGFPRPDAGENVCDIGAYEFQDCSVTYNGTFKGNLNITSGMVCIMNGTVAGNVTQSGGELFASNATIGGNVQITGGGFFSIESTAVNGDLQIQNIPAGSAQNQICATQVKNDLQFDNNGTPVVIGTNSVSCPGNTIGNDLQINNNIAAVQVFDDTVGGNLLCQGNSSISGAGDTAKSLLGQCASF